MLDLAVQTGGILNQKAKKTGYSLIKSSGFQAVDFNIMQCHDPAGLSLDIFKENRKVAEGEGLYFSQVHEPLWGKRMDLQTEEEYMFSVVKQAIQITKTLNSPHLVVHPYQSYDRVDMATQRQLNLHFFRKLAPVALDAGVTLCIENKPTVSMLGTIVHGFCSESGELAEFVDELNDISTGEPFGTCFDIGHAHVLRQDVGEQVRKLGHRLKVLHLHDNDGTKDLHRIPFSVENGVNWSSFLLGLQDIHYRGVLDFEIYNSLISISAPLQKAMLGYVSEVGKQFSDIITFQDRLNQYKGQEIVLFGAGKMLDVFLKRYPEHPPVFAVDNNESLWGMEKHGVPIYAPEKLKEDPQKVCIICNGFYEEIAEQIEGYGVKNVLLSEEIGRMTHKPFTRIW